MLSIAEIADHLQQGHIGVIPTDTVYGVVCSAHNTAAVRRLYGLKDRDNKPGTIIAATIEQVAGLGIPRRYLSAVEQYWPNPISIIIPVGDKLPELQLGKGSLAIRIPDNPELHTLLLATGPLLTSSANPPGQQPAATIIQAKQYFSSDVDFYVDGGNLSSNKPSTIIRIVDDAVEVLREGAVTIAESGEIV